jgi:hypothetical protein
LVSSEIEILYPITTRTKSELNQLINTFLNNVTTADTIVTTNIEKYYTQQNIGSKRKLDIEERSLLDAVKDKPMWYAMLKAHYLCYLAQHIEYMYDIYPIDLGKFLIGGSGSSNKMLEKLQEPYVNYEYENLETFMEYSYDVKSTIIRLCKEPVKNRILKDVFNKYYSSSNYNRYDVIKRIKIIRACRKLLMDGSLSPSRTSSTSGFTLFKEAITLYPQYIDPFTVIYMHYTNSLVPPIFLRNNEVPLKKPSQTGTKKVTNSVAAPAAGGARPKKR